MSLSTLGMRFKDFMFLGKSAVGLDIADHTIEVMELSGSSSHPKILGMARTSLELGVVERGRIKNEEKSFDIKPIIKDGAKTTIFRSKAAEPEKKFAPMSRNEQIKHLLHSASESNKQVEEFDKPLPRKERTITLEDKEEPKIETKKDKDNMFSMFD